MKKISVSGKKILKTIEKSAIIKNKCAICKYDYVKLFDIEQNYLTKKHIPIERFDVNTK